MTSRHEVTMGEAPTVAVNVVGDRSPPRSGFHVSAATSSLPQILFVTYIHLWVVEGALRKWIAPGLGTALYVGRDALFVGGAIALLLASKRQHPLRVGELWLAIIGGLIAVWALVQVALSEVPALLGFLG